MGLLILRSSVVSGGSAPAIGDSNVSFAGADVQVINPALPSILDFRQDYTQSPRNTALWLGGVERLATATYMPGGGYYQQGCMRFVLGQFTSDPVGNPLGDHPFGIGQILGFGELQVVTIGLLWRHGPTLLPGIERDQKPDRSARGLGRSERTADDHPERGLVRRWYGCTSPLRRYGV